MPDPWRLEEASGMIDKLVTDLTKLSVGAPQGSAEMFALNRLIRRLMDTQERIATDRKEAGNA